MSDISIDGITTTTVFSDDIANLPNPTVPEEVTTIPFTQMVTAKRKMVFWNDTRRPYEGAIEQYLKMFDDAINCAKKYLDERPYFTYANVYLKLFDHIYVDCKDEDGNNVTKRYFVHEAHYGPYLKNILSNDKQRNIANFFHRYYDIYNDIWGEGSFAPFRYTQIRLLRQGYYLVDNSRIETDENGVLRVKTNIILSRNMPAQPMRLPHGYGFIPLLGPIAK